MSTISKKFGNYWAAWTWETAPRLAKRVHLAYPGLSQPMALWVSTAVSLLSEVAIGNFYFIYKGVYKFSSTNVHIYLVSAGIGNK